jgi:hypothetical protein
MNVSASRRSNEQLPGTWADDAERLLQDWRNRAYAAQSAYYIMAERFRRWNYLLGVPVVILSGLVGTAIFADLQQRAPYMQWLIGSVSILAAVLSSLQTFLRLSDSAAEHGAAAAWYSAIRRDAEQILALPREARGHPKTCLDVIRQEMNKAGQKAPPLSEKLWNKFAQRFSVKEPPLSADE